MGRSGRIAVLMGCLCGFTARAGGFDLSDAQVKDEMARRASLLCPGYTTERGMPGIRAVNVDALRVLLAHKFTMCPDRRIQGPVGAVWNSRWGVLLWNPNTQGSMAVMTRLADTMTHSLEFPNELSVYDLEGKPLKGQIVPSFEPRDTFDGF